MRKEVLVHACSRPVLVNTRKALLFDHSYERGEFEPARIAFVSALVFALAHVQAPLFSSNQNTYLLHAFAPESMALRHDWLASTADPQPLFTALLRASNNAFGPHSSFLWMGAASLLYAHSLWRIARSTWRQLPPHGLAVGFAIVVLLQAGAQDALRSRVFGGLANQYILGSVWEPSVAGVLLLFAIASALELRAGWCTFGLVAGASLHPTYVLQSLIIASGWLLERRIATGRLRSGLPLMAATLLGLLPIVLYVAKAFPHFDNETAERSACLLVERRIQHHALASVWFDRGAALACVLWCGLAVVLWRRPIGKYLGVAAVCSAVLVLAVVVSGSCRAALLFPQRASALALPITSTLALTGACGYVAQRFALRTQKSLYVVVLALAASVVVGVHGWYSTMRSDSNDSAALIDAIRHHVPVTGTILLVPPDLREDLRLRADRSLVVDFKSHPFGDREIVEWWERVQLAYALHRTFSEPLIDEAATRWHASHVIAPVEWQAPPARLRVLYRNATYQLLLL